MTQSVKAKFNPRVEREKWIIEELMKPPGSEVVVVVDVVLVHGCFEVGPDP